MCPCLQDNPGAKKAIFQKSVKYAEQVRDHSKTCISIMACGNINGLILPPYTVYQVQRNECVRQLVHRRAKGSCVYQFTIRHGFIWQINTSTVSLNSMGREGIVKKIQLR
jgi:hypothetical protein